MLRSLSKMLKHGVKETDALSILQKQGSKLNKVQQRKVLKGKMRSNKAAYRNYNFSPALSLFARTPGAKDKKKRKRRLKALAAGALGASAITGALSGRKQGRKLMESLIDKTSSAKLQNLLATKADQLSAKARNPLQKLKDRVLRIQGKKVKKAGRLGAALGALLETGGTASVLGTGYALGRPDKTRRDVLNEILEESANAPL